MNRVGLYPQEMRPCDTDRPSFSDQDLAKLTNSGAVLEADGYYYAYTFATASRLHKYVNDHYTLDLWARAVARGQVRDDERTDADLVQLSKKKSSVVVVKGKPKLSRDQTTLG
jgi:hypothetical protein